MSPRSIDDLIEKRAAEREEAYAAAQEERAAARRFLSEFEREHATLWREYHRRMILTHQQLADEHREKLACLAGVG